MWQVLGAELRLELQTSVSMKMYGEVTLLGCAPPWIPPSSSVTQHMFPRTITWRLRITYPRCWRRELLQEDSNSETHKNTFRGMEPLGTVGLRTYKDMGNFWVWFWFVDWRGARQVLVSWENRILAGMLSVPCSRLESYK